MVWHIKKTSILGLQIVVYYKGNNCWTEDFVNVQHIPLKQKQKKRIIFGLLLKKLSKVGCHCCQ